MATLKYLWLVFGLVSLIGCGSEGLSTAPVQGRVTLDGVPLASGIVHFLPKAGPAASGSIDSDGTYRLSTRSQGDGAVLGSHRVYLAPPPTDLGDYSMDDYIANKPPPSQERNSGLPNKYFSAATSGLSAEVNSGKNQVDLNLISGR